MPSLRKHLLFLHGHIVDAPLACSLAGDTFGPGPHSRWRMLVACAGWLGRGAIRAWPH